MARIDSPYFLTQTRPLRPMGRVREKAALVKVDKTGLVIAQSEPLRDRIYLDWFAFLPCAICGAVGECVGHHLECRGTGYKTSDDRCVPLCPVHHVNGDCAIHNFRGRGGHAAYWQLHGIDADLMAAWLREQFLANKDDLEAAHEIIRKCGPQEWMR